VTIARELLGAVVAELKANPSLARDLSELLRVAQTPGEATPNYLRVRDFAVRVAMSERTVWRLVSRGLPMVGAGHARRVDVARAEAWLREQREMVDDAVERQARAAARRAARRAAE
jgi:hypothetical protein